MEARDYGTLNEQAQSHGAGLNGKIWEMNYLEASIYLEEGENNDKFDSHPSNRCSLPAYMVTHNHWFYLLDLGASLILLIIAVMEPPAVSIFKDLPTGVHGSIELFALSVLGISIGMQVRWLGWRTFLHHKRSLIKTITWILMLTEALTVLVRQQSHFRVTRSFRPIFLLDNRYLGIVRRFMRQILQSLPQIFEVLFLLLFALCIFTILGFYLFSPDQDNPYFSSLSLGFVSLYVLLTTANYPDVMMPSYAKSRWSAGFFIAYLSVTLYFLMSLVLATVFVVFSHIEKDKFRKLLLHKRDACRRAFRLLITRIDSSRITFKHFKGLMSIYRKKKSCRDVYLMFRSLNKTRSGYLTLEEFYGIYDAADYEWRFDKTPVPWFDDLFLPLKLPCSVIRTLVVSKAFKILVYCVIATSGIILVVRTMLISSEYIHHLEATWDQIGCIMFYVVELCLKLIGFGFRDFTKSVWNIYDIIVTSLSVIGIILSRYNEAFFYIVVLRQLRLLKLFRIRRTYRVIFRTFITLLPRILSAVVIIIVIYYFFAIIGMELFSQYNMKNCCIDTTVEQYYHEDNATIFNNFYYLNNFNNILISGVTLFELTVVNNWFIIMEGYAAVSGEWSRIYFMFFYLVMMIVMSIVVAFIIEAFTFRMEYYNTFQDSVSESESVKLILDKREVEFMYGEEKSLENVQEYIDAINCETEVAFLGIQKETKGILQMRMYKNLIPCWLRDNEAEQIFNDNAQNLTEDSGTRTCYLNTSSDTSADGAHLLAGSSGFNVSEGNRILSDIVNSDVSVEIHNEESMPDAPIFPSFQLIESDGIDDRHDSTDSLPQPSNV